MHCWCLFVYPDVLVVGISTSVQVQGTTGITPWYNPLVQVVSRIRVIFYHNYKKIFIVASKQVASLGSFQDLGFGNLVTSLVEPLYYLPLVTIVLVQLREHTRSLTETLGCWANSLFFRKY